MHTHYPVHVHYVTTPSWVHEIRCAQIHTHTVRNYSHNSLSNASVTHSNFPELMKCGVIRHNTKPCKAGLSLRKELVPVTSFQHLLSSLSFLSLALSLSQFTFECGEGKTGFSNIVVLHREHRFILMGQVFLKTSSGGFLKHQQVTAAGEIQYDRFPDDIKSKCEYCIHH